MRKLIVVMLLSHSLLAQNSQMYPQNGVSDERPELYALKGINLYLDFQTFIPDAVLVISQGKVLAAGKVAIPAQAQVIEMVGKSVYPSFVELYSDYGLNLPSIRPLRMEDYGSSKAGAFGQNEALISEYHAEKEFQPQPAQDWLKSGFGTLLTHRTDGIARGTSALVSLHPQARKALLKSQAAAFYSFDKGSSTQAYPSSLAGAMALLRQTFYDAQWYSRSRPEWTDLTLSSWQENLKLPKFFVLSHHSDAFLVEKLSLEFNQKFAIIGTGQEWRFASEIAAIGSVLVLPLNFPLAFDPNKADLQSLQNWHHAPANPLALLKKGCKIAFTTKGLKDKTDFLKNIRKALPDSSYKKVFLKALLETPAELLGLSTIGNLRPGSWANFLICNGDIFDSQTQIEQNWVQGQKNELVAPLKLKKGEYSLKIGGLDTASLQIGRDLVVFSDTSISIKPVLKGSLLSFYFAYRNRFYFLEGVVNGERIEGISTWSAVWKAPEKPSQDPVKRDSLEVGPEFSRAKSAIKTLIQNATIWTGESQEVLYQSDILLENGKIAKIGRNLSATQALVVDGTGLFVTAGIIDEHSHIALQRGVNEWSVSVSSEVRMEDGLNSQDFNIYRQLAGGVTAVQLLHGSANPIGGQSALIKLRYGVKPQNLLIANAPKFIKFALGENPKRSNSPNTHKRYPQTRMGVEQSIADAFLQARNYQSTRRDLRLEALQEILAGKRHITCHSYVESEILMLMDLAEQMGFKVNTFTHILEGYKVAARMKGHGAAGSTFADWWAYKYEVKDAIPYNAALMHRAGVLVAINSDDAEMGRRLNQEAAKTIKYGGLTEQEAWMTVTLNPAKMLHLDDRMGSLKVGKDADVVLWSQNPLSVYAKAEKTWVDGVLEFDRSQEEQRLNALAAQEQRLLLLMIKAIAQGSPLDEAQKSPSYHYHCDSE
jgi:imidazolonepropionase-like amidohydrolase